MSNFALNTTDPYGDIISSINYLLATQNVLDANANVNLGNALVANVSTGQITTAADPDYISYLYQYLHVRYADSATGSVNFSTSPTNRLYFGLRNSASAVGSSNPADYIWTQVVGGFGTTKFLFYSTIGGRQIVILVTTAAPTNYEQAQDDVPIDLDVLTITITVSPTLNQIYDVGQFFVQTTNGDWSPAPNANGYISTTTTITASEADALVGRITRTLSYNTLNPYVVNANSSLSGNITSVTGSNVTNDYLATVSNVGGYDYWIMAGNILGPLGYTRFTTNYNMTVAGGSTVVDLYMVGPGGWGESSIAGNGGEIITYSNISVPAGSYTLTVGGLTASGGTFINTNTSTIIDGVSYAATAGGQTSGTGGSGAGGAGVAGDGGYGLPIVWPITTSLPTFTANADTNGPTYPYGNGQAWFSGGGAISTTNPSIGYGGGWGGGGSFRAGTTQVPVPAVGGVPYPGYYGGGGSARNAGTAGRTYGGSGVIILRQARSKQNFISNLWSITTSNPTDINPGAFSNTAPYYTINNFNENITYTSANGSASTPIEAVVVPKGNTGTTGSRGFVPLAYVVTSSDPTSFSNAQYTTSFSAPRANTVAPIGTGYTPITGDTAQFIYTTTNAFVVKTFNANTNGWTTANGQVISGNLIVTGTITSAQLNTNDIYTLNIQSTNANIGNVNSNGFWLQSNTGDARFGGNTSIGNNLTVGNNATIGGNLLVTGLITTGNLNNNTVNTTTITPNAISFFGSYQNNAELVFTSPSANTFYSLTNTVTITTTVSNTKIFVTGQAAVQWIANCLVPTATLTGEIGVRMRDVSQNVTYILGSQDILFTITSAGLFQLDQNFYETGLVLTLANVGEYGFGVYGYYGTSGNVTVPAFGYEATRNAVQSLKR